MIPKTSPLNALQKPDTIRSNIVGFSMPKIVSVDTVPVAKLAAANATLPIKDKPPVSAAVPNKAPSLGTNLGTSLEATFLSLPLSGSFVSN